MLCLYIKVVLLFCLIKIEKLSNFITVPVKMIPFTKLISAKALFLIKSYK